MNAIPVVSPVMAAVSGPEGIVDVNLPNVYARKHVNGTIEIEFPVGVFLSLDLSAIDSFVMKFERIECKPLCDVKLKLNINGMVQRLTKDDPMSGTIIDAEGRVIHRSDANEIYMVYADGTTAICLSPSIGLTKTDPRHPDEFVWSSIPGDGFCGVYCLMTYLSIAHVKRQDLAATNIGSAKDFLRKVAPHAAPGGHLESYLQNLHNDRYVTTDVLLELCQLFGLGLAVYSDTYCAIHLKGMNGTLVLHHQGEHFNLMEQCDVHLNSAHELIVRPLNVPGDHMWKSQHKIVHVVVKDDMFNSLLRSENFSTDVNSSEPVVFTSDFRAASMSGRSLGYVIEPHARSQKFTPREEQIHRSAVKASMPVLYAKDLAILKNKLPGYVPKIRTVLRGGAQYGPPANSNPIGATPPRNPPLLKEGEVSSKDVIPVVKALLCGGITINNPMYTSADRLKNPEKIKAFTESMRVLSSLAEHKMTMMKVKDQGRVGAGFNLVFTQQRMEDIAGLRVDFANKKIGGGVMSKGCVQEEIMFMTHPAALASRAIVGGPLAIDEAFLMTGLAGCADYSGYASSFSWRQVNNVIFRDWIAIDAPQVSRSRESFDPRNLAHARRKFEIACDAAAARGQTLVSGAWGCGAFGGCLELMLALQIHVATERKVPLVLSLLGRPPAEYLNMTSLMANFSLMSPSEQLFALSSSNVNELVARINSSIGDLAPSAPPAENEPDDEIEVVPVDHDERSEVAESVKSCETSISSAPSTIKSKRRRRKRNHKRKSSSCDSQSTISSSTSTSSENSKDVSFDDDMNVVEKMKDARTYSSVCEPRAEDCNSYLKFISTLDIDPKSLAKDVILNKLKTDPHESSRLLDALQRNIDSEGSTMDVILPQNLDTFEMAAISAAFPNLNIISKKKGNYGHDYARATTTCATLHVLLMAGLDPRKQYVSKSHSFVVADVGGNPVTHAQAGRGWVHSCCPDIDAQDHVRRERTRYRRMTGSFPVNTFDNPRFFCTDKGQDCKETAEVVTFIHSTYDMSASDIADIMRNFNAGIGVGCIHFDPMILLGLKGDHVKQGVFKTLKMSWEIAGKKIRFTFHDNSKVYEHKLKTYLSVILNQYLYGSSEAVCYSVELMTNIDCTLFFTILPIQRIPRDTMSTVAFSFPQNKDDVLIQLLIPDFRKLNRNWFMKIDRKRLMKCSKLVSVVVNRKFYEKVLKFAITAKEGAFKITSVILYAKHADANRIIGNHSVVVGEDLSAYVLNIIGTHAYIVAYQDRWCMTQATSLYTQVLDFLRGVRTKPLFERLWSTFTICDAKPDKCDYSNSWKFWINFLHSNNSFDTYVPKARPLEMYASSTLMKNFLRPYTCSLDRYVLTSNGDREKLAEVLAREIEAPIKYVIEDESLTVNGCDVPVKLIPVPGNKNLCAFEAVVKSEFVAYDDPADLREALLSYCKDVGDGRSVKILCDAEGVDRGVLISLSKYLNVCLCVHSTSGVMKLNENAGRTVHLQHGDGHYDALVPCMVDRSIPFSNVAFDYPGADEKELVAVRKTFMEHSSALRHLMKNRSRRFDQRVLNPNVNKHLSIAFIDVVDNFVPERSHVTIMGSRVGYVDDLSVEMFDSVTAITTEVLTAKVDEIYNSDSYPLSVPDTKVLFMSDYCRQYKSYVERVAVGGTCVVYIGSHIDEDVVDLFRKLYDEFDVVYAYKPHSLWSENPEFYLVAKTRLARSSKYPLDRCVIDSVVKYINKLQVDALNHMMQSLADHGVPVDDECEYSDFYGAGKPLTFDQFKIKLSNARKKNSKVVLSLHEIHMIQADERWARVYKSNQSYIRLKLPSFPKLRNRIAKAFSPVSHQSYSAKNSYKLSWWRKLKLRLRVWMYNLFECPTQEKDVSKGSYIKKDRPRPVKMVNYIAEKKSKTTKDSSDVEPNEIVEGVPFVAPLNGRNLVAFPMLQVSDRSSLRNNQVREHFAIQMTTVKMAEKICDEVWSDGLKSFLTKSYSRHHLEAKYPDLGIASGRSGGSLVFTHTPKVLKEEYRWVYNGEKIVEVAKNSKWPAIVVAELSMLLEKDSIDTHGELITKLQNGKVLDLECDDLIFVNGVPGCGKTQSIIDLIVARMAAGEDLSSTLVLTVAKEAKEDLVLRLAACKVNVSVMTVGSYLMHTNNHSEEYSHVYLDEGLMEHPGAIFLIMYLSRCQYMRLSGDELQIPYIVRVSTLQKDGLVKYNSLLDSVNGVTAVDVTERSNASWRCPIDVCKMLDPLYRQIGGSMTSMSTVARSIKFMKIGSAGEVPFDKGHVYLTFTQAEKTNLIHMMKNVCGGGHIPKVSTVHEFQGDSAPFVNLVRLERANTNVVYKSQPHRIVALSRHTVEFVYYTVCEDDPMYDWLKKDAPDRGGATGTFYRRPLVQHTLGGVERKMYSGNVEDIKFMEEPFCNNSEIADVVATLPVETGVNVVPMPDRDVPELDFDVPLPDSDDASYEDLQMYHDLALPGCAGVDFSHRELLFHEADHTFMDAKMSIVPMDDGPGQFNYDCLRPSVLTAMFPPVKQNQLVLMRCVEKRNLNVDNQREFAPSESLAKDMVDAFLRNFVDKELFEIVTRDKTVYSVANLDAWLRTQNSHLLDSLELDVPYADQRKNTFELMIKSNAKPKMNSEPLSELPIPQVIAAHSKNMNLLYSPIFNIVQTKIMACLKPFAKIFCGVSAEQFAESITEFYHPSKYINDVYKHKLKRVVEADHSKYDKSQDKLFLEMDVYLMRLMGVPENLVQLWYECHILTVLRSPACKLVYYIAYQRKSGDSSTYLFNTLVNMCMIAYAYDGSSYDLALFSGDDSLIIGDLCNDSPGLFATAFNMTTKIFQFSVPYFCSKFLLPGEEKWHFVPDPLKLVVKLGRHDLVNWEHVEDYRKSLLDLWKGCFNFECASLLDIGVLDRYKVDLCHYNMLIALKMLCSDAEKFKQLYYHEEGTILSSDPSRPNLDI